MTLLYEVVFYLFGTIAIASACAFVTRKSPVAAALWLVNVLFSLSALYVLLDAQFIGAVQILVYAGAIMVVFLFVIMLLNLGHPDQLTDTRGAVPGLAAGALAILVLAALLIRLPHPEPLESARLAPTALADSAAQGGAVLPLVRPLFSEYLLAFEVTSVVLLAAVIGAVVLGRRRTAGPAHDEGRDQATTSTAPSHANPELTAHAR